MTLRIFISYDHQQLALAEHLKAGIELGGHQVYLDTVLHHGDDWARKLEQALQWTAEDLATGRFVLLLTDRAVRPGGFCLDELTYAMNLKLPVFPLRVEPHVKIPIEIIRRQYCDLSQCLPAEDYPEVFQRQVARLLENLESNKNEYEGLQSGLLNRLQPLDFTEELHRTPHFYGRQWLLEKVQAWLTDPHAPPIFWLTAEPGVGKTAFAAWLARQLEAAAAVHFCRDGLLEKNDPARLVGSLAYALSQRLVEGYGEYLLTQAVNLEKDDAGSLFDRLLVQPLAGDEFAPPPGEQPLLFILDGLDEADDPQAGNRVAKLLAQQAGRLPPWLRILVSSRPHPGVMGWLQGLEPVELPADGEHNQADLQTFIRQGLAEFNRGRPLSDSLVQTLLEKSEGIFLYIELLRMELPGLHMQLDQAGRFPQGLNGMYQQFFERQFPRREVYSALVRPALELATAAYEALPLADLQTWLGWNNYSRGEFEEAVQGLFRLEGERLAAPHRSLLDWVADRQKAGMKFWADPAAGHRILAGEGWRMYEKAGLEGLDGYLLRRLPFHLLADGREDDLARLLGDLQYLARLYGQDQYLLFEAWGRAKEAGLKIEQVYAAVIEQPGNHPPGLLFNLALMLQQMGQGQMALVLYEHLARVYQEGKNEPMLQASLGNQALILKAQGELAEAMRLLKMQEEICRRLNDPAGLSRTLGNQALILMDQGELAEAMRLLKEQEEICRRLNDPAGLQASLGNQANILSAQGELAEAMRLLKMKEEICRRLNNWQGLAISFANQAAILAQQGDRTGALALARQAFGMAESRGYIPLARQIQQMIQKLGQGA